MSMTLYQMTYRPIIGNLRDFVPQLFKMSGKHIGVDEIRKADLKLKNGKSVSRGGWGNSGRFFAHYPWSYSDTHLKFVIKR